MSVFGEFELPAGAFALAETLNTLPEAVVEIERVVASEKMLTPYFWVANVSADDFERTAEDDSSIRNVSRLDTFDEGVLYRAEWTENIESIVYAYTKVGAVILDATGQEDMWQVQLRFDDQDQLTSFQKYCAENDISFQIKRLYELSHPHTGRQYGLTDKQHEALVEVWREGFFESPAETSLEEVADDLGISQQALSQRLRKAHNALIANTLATPPPMTE